MGSGSAGRGVVHNTPPSVAALVRHRIYERPVAATLMGDVLYSDQIFYRHAGPRRYFWLPEEDAQLIYEPFGWRNEWYVDLVSITRQDIGGTPCFEVRDEYVDIVIDDMGPTYRILDLDEAGDALVQGQITAAQLARTLTSAQRFLERHLHRGASFPPAAVATLFAKDHRYPSWSPDPVQLHSTEPG